MRLTVDAAGTILEASPAVRLRFGRGDRDLVGSSLNDLVADDPGRLKEVLRGTVASRRERVVLTSLLLRTLRGGVRRCIVRLGPILPCGDRPPDRLWLEIRVAREREEDVG